MLKDKIAYSKIGVGNSKAKKKQGHQLLRDGVARSKPVAMILPTRKASSQVGGG